MRTLWVLLFALGFLVQPARSWSDELDAKTRREPLGKLHGVGVLIEALGAEEQEGGLTESMLRADVEARLREAGITVLATDEAGNRGGVFLYVYTQAIERSTGDYVYCVRAELLQSVRLMRDPALIVDDASTWRSMNAIGTCEAEGLTDAVRGSVRDRTDEFINAYLAANPKKPGK